MDWEPTEDEYRIMQHESEQRYYHKRDLEDRRRQGKGAILKPYDNKLWAWKCPSCDSANYLKKYTINARVRETVYCTICGREHPLIEPEEVLAKRQEFIERENRLKAEQEAEEQRKKELETLAALKAKYEGGDGSNV